MKFFSLYWKAWICFLAIIIAFEQAQAQTSPNTIGTHSLLSDGFFRPQTPDVWNMIKYGDATIDHYSGTLGLSIPVYTYKDANFEIPVSIDYASNGYQPGIDCDVVGQGWYLNVGGAITREVHGIPDDEIRNFDWKWQYYDMTQSHPAPSESMSLQIYGYGFLYAGSVEPNNLDYVYSGIAGKDYMPVWMLTDDKNSGVPFGTGYLSFQLYGKHGFVYSPTRWQNRTVQYQYPCRRDKSNVRYEYL